MLIFFIALRIMLRIEKNTMIKSRTLKGSFRYVYFPNKNPKTTIFTVASAMKIPVMTVDIRSMDFF